MNPVRLLEIIDLQNDIAEAKMSLADVMKVVVDRAAVLTSASGAVLELVDGEEMVYRAACGSAATAVGVRLPRESSLSGLCVAQAVPIRCDDTENDARVNRDVCRKLGVASMICVPLFHKGRPSGVLKVLSGRKGTFTEESVATLELLARIIAVSMHQAREFESTLHQSLHDGLTGLPNRRAFQEGLAQELERVKRHGRPLTLVLLDLDGFKGLNDRWGHGAGDDALRKVGSILKGALRITDECFRLGGDEFALLLPDTGRDGARIVVDRVRAGVAAARMGEGTVGVSAGVAEARGEDAEAFTAAADAALYEEKRRKKSGPKRDLPAARA